MIGLFMQDALLTVLCRKDEYLVPMGDFKSMGEVADELDESGVKVAVFKSSPAKPRLNLLE